MPPSNRIPPIDAAHTNIVAPPAQTSRPGLAKATTERTRKLQELLTERRVSYEQLARCWKKKDGKPVTWQRAQAIVRRPSGLDTQRFKALPESLREEVLARMGGRKS